MLLIKNENPDKVIDIVGEIFSFNKQKEGKGLKILTPKQILQRLPLALAQVKAGHISENILKKPLKKYITIK